MTFEAILLQQVINGLNLGPMYSLLALGFTMVYCIHRRFFGSSDGETGPHPVASRGVADNGK